MECVDHSDIVIALECNSDDRECVHSFNIKFNALFDAESVCVLPDNELKIDATEFEKILAS